MVHARAASTPPREALPLACLVGPAPCDALAASCCVRHGRALVQHSEAHGESLGKEESGAWHVLPGPQLARVHAASTAHLATHVARQARVGRGVHALPIPPARHSG